MSDEQMDAANAGTLIGGPRRYRKKPVVIEAIQFSGQNDEAVGAFVGEHGRDPESTEPTWVIETLEGPMTARVGWWIIKGVKGEFYPCDPEVFAATYEPE